MNVYVDLDDLCDLYADEFCREVDRWRAHFPSFVATVFTIPALTSSKTIERVRRECPGFEFAVHGWDHKRKTDWDTTEGYAAATLDDIDFGLYDKGFKAPWWRLGQKAAEAVLGRGLWVATNNANGIIGERVYNYQYGMREVYSGMCYDSDTEIHWHGHVQSQIIKPPWASRGWRPARKPNGMVDTYYHFVQAMGGSYVFKTIGSRFDMETPSPS